MNVQLLSSLGIDSNIDLKTMLESLEEKQFEFLERLETVNDENRRQEINMVLEEINKEIEVVKNQIQVLNTAVIWDTEELVEKKDTKEAEKNIKKTVDKEINEKIEKFKEKEVKKQEKEVKKESDENQTETSKNQTETSKNQNVSSQTQNSNPNVSTDNTKVSATDNNSSEYMKGQAEYNNQNYAEAFKIFKELSEKGNASAQYSVALMYRDGVGVPKDFNRSLYWLKRSSEAGETDAQYAYGSALLDQCRNDEKKVKEGYKYLRAAADKGNWFAMIKYVDSALSQIGGKKEISKAMEYCDKLKATETDSFNKKEYDNFKVKLKELKKKGNTPTKAKNGSRKKKKKIPWWLIILLIILYMIISRKINFEKDMLEQELSSFPIMQEQNEEMLEINIRITADAANIRSGPGTSYDVIGSGKKGDEFVATGVTETTESGRVWYEIYLDDSRESIGWASEIVMEIIE